MCVGGFAGIALVVVAVVSLFCGGACRRRWRHKPPTHHVRLIAPSCSDLFLFQVLTCRWVFPCSCLYLLGQPPRRVHLQPLRQTRVQQQRRQQQRRQQLRQQLQGRQRSRPRRRRQRDCQQQRRHEQPGGLVAKSRAGGGRGEKRLPGFRQKGDGPSQC